MNNTNYITTTGNPIVDAIGKINITGNIIPEAWYGTIQKKRNHPYFHAIILLSEILYWYRPTEICNEETGKRTYKKKFYDDFWQISMGALSEKFDLSKDQIRDALDFLENESKVIVRHYRTIKTRTGIASNVMYIELIPDVLLNLTYPASVEEKKDTGNGNFPDSYCKNTEDVLENTPDPTRENSNTYTKNTTENNKENTEKTTTTEGGAVCCCDNSLSIYIKDKFSNYHLTDKDITIITSSAKEGTKDIDRAFEYIINYNKPIKNIVRFIIATINNGWCIDQITVSDNTKSHKDTHGFEGRNYDYGALEDLLVNKF